jgi:tRNA C32,U32 (ribose-2'-O)-methylase TrmJ
LLTPAQADRVDVVLVSPRNPLNIGAAARAMANFGFSRLSIVAPFAQNWMEAKSAVGAPDLLREARVYATLAEALAHATLVLGTGSLDKRKPIQTILSLPEAAAQLRLALHSENLGAPGLDSETWEISIQPGAPGLASGIANDRSSLGSSETGDSPSPHKQPKARIALVFGSEKHGLTSDDLSWCHALIAIETCETQPSMNLGQAVAVCLYEISRNPEPSDASVAQQPERPKIKGTEHPDTEQLDRLAALVEETMEAVNYSTRGIRSANGEALRVLLRRLMPNEPDLRRMMGLFRRILWQLGRGSGKV